MIDNKNLGKPTQKSTISCEIVQIWGKTRQNKMDDFFPSYNMAILYSNERYLRAELISEIYFNIYLTILV